MKHQTIIFSYLVSFFLLITACSNEKNDTPNKPSSQKITFTINEEDFGNDIELTRSKIGKMKPEKFNLCEGIEAEVSIEPDATKPESLTRIVTSGNHYTIVAFRAGTDQEVGEVKGHFDVGTGNFIQDSDSRTLQVEVGNYDFVCYTHEFATRSGKTIKIPANGIRDAFIGKTENVYISPTRSQKVAFTMKHPGARVRIKIAAFTEADKLANVQASLAYPANSGIKSVNYDITTQQYTNSTEVNPTEYSVQQMFDIPQPDIFDLKAYPLRFNARKGNNYLGVFAGTKPEQLTLAFTGGTLYNKTLNIPAKHLKNGAAFLQNGSYTILLKLRPKYQYLFEDDRVGYLDDTERQGHIPIAVVCAPGKAVCLYNFWDFMTYEWTKETDWTRQMNDITFTDWDELIANTTSGKHWTWDASGSADGVVKAEAIKNGNPAYPPFYKAKDCIRVVNQYLAPKGKALVPSLTQKERWYLPSLHDWKDIFVNLGFGDLSRLTGITYTPWKGALASRAFQDANGAQPFASNQPKYFWTSNEYAVTTAVYMDITNSSIKFFYRNKNEKFTRYSLIFVSF